MISTLYSYPHAYDLRLPRPKSLSRSARLSHRIESRMMMCQRYLTGGHGSCTTPDLSCHWRDSIMMGGIRYKTRQTTFHQTWKCDFISRERAKWLDEWSNGCYPIGLEDWAVARESVMFFPPSILSSLRTGLSLHSPSCNLSSRAIGTSINHKDRGKSSSYAKVWIADSIHLLFVPKNGPQHILQPLTPDPCPGQTRNWMMSRTSNPRERYHGV